MKRRKSYIVVHRDPDVCWDKIEENWSKMVDLESATWLRTYYNMDEKMRFCLWLAPNEDKLRKIFAGFQINWESILEVEETIPDIWARRYRAEAEAEERKDSVTSSEILAREGTL